MKNLLLLAALALLAVSASAGDFPGFPKPFTATQSKADGSTFAMSFQGTRVRAVGKGKAAAMGTMLSDLKDGTAMLVLEDSKEYFAYKGEADRTFFDPCAVQKQALAQGAAGMTCKKEGTAVVNGRKTDKYVTSMPGADQKLESYFDPELKVVIKQQTPDGIQELKDIKVGAANGPFEVPGGYKKISQEQYNAKVVQRTRRGKK